MSKLLLAVHSYPGANHRIEAHWPFWEKSGADQIIGIGTEGAGCKWPAGALHVEIGADHYIGGSHLPKRLIDTMKFMLCLDFDRFCIVEWDCLFFKPLPEFSGMGGFHAGGQLPNARTKNFYHNPWCFDFSSGNKFLKKAEELLPEVGGAECSPDVFFGWVCEQAQIEVQQPWLQFTQNTIESAEGVEAARKAYLEGATCIHGVKHRSTLDQILS